MLDLCEDHDVPERDRAGHIEQRAHALMGPGRHGNAVALFESLRPTQRAGQALVLEAVIAVALSRPSRRAFTTRRDADRRAPVSPPALVRAADRAAAVGGQRVAGRRPARRSARPQCPWLGPGAGCRAVAAGAAGVTAPAMSHRHRRGKAGHTPCCGIRRPQAAPAKRAAYRAPHPDPLPRVRWRRRTTRPLPPVGKCWGEGLGVS